MRASHIIFTIFAILGVNSQTIDSPTYRAGVVEYAPVNGTVEQATQGNLLEYMKIIEDIKIESLDILVFPEATFNRVFSNPKPESVAIFVPSEEENANPCDDNKYDKILTELSCAVRSAQIYVVVNVVEKAECSETQLEDCNGTEFVLFNTNIVFDRNGTIISRYRKINLFGETGLINSDNKKLGLFETDFGVKFGHFICFDLLFQKPASETIELGDVRNIVFPTMWFSELSSLTAVQIQQAFAVSHDVNLLASGANNPHVGSTGTGIYSGKSGALKSIMSGKRLTEVLISDVPKTPNDDVPMNPGETNTEHKNPVEMDSLFLKSENLTYYESITIDPKKEKQNIHLTFNDVKCHFEIALNPKFIGNNDTNKHHYIYRAVAFDGVKSFEVRNLGVIECAIMACIDENDLNSCSKRFPAYEDVHPQLEFASINLYAKLPKPLYNDTANAKTIDYYPTTLLTSILPLKVDDFEFIINDSNDPKYIDVTLSLKKQHTEILAFGIFGRTYNRDDTPLTGSSIGLQHAKSLIISLLIILGIIYRNDL